MGDNTGRVSPEVRFWLRVTKSDGCWLWDRADRNGYGRFEIDGVETYAHRVSFELHHGPIPAGMTVDHLCHGWDASCVGLASTCEHRRCVRPDHLEAVSQGDNSRRGRAREVHQAAAAERMECPNGHPYDVAYMPGAIRRCRECVRVRQARRPRRTPFSIAEITTLKAQGLTNREVAERVGCSTTTVSMAINGKVGFRQGVPRRDLRGIEGSL